MWITSFRLIDPALCRMPVVSHRYPVSKKVRAGFGEPHPAEGRIFWAYKDSTAAWICRVTAFSFLRIPFL